MNETIREEWRMAKKPHRCSLCCKKIEAGERYKYIVGKDGGMFFTFHAHERCIFVAEEIWSYVDPDEGMNEECFYDGCCDVCRAFVCPDCGKRDTDECNESYCMDKLLALFQTKELYRDSRDKFSVSYWKVRERTTAREVALHEST